MKNFKPNPNYCIEVFDNILSKHYVEQIDSFLKNSYFTQGNKDNITYITLKLFNNFVINGKCNKGWENLFNIMLNSINKFFNPHLLYESLPTLKMQVNASDLSTIDEAHQDVYNDFEGYTILYYANKEWDINYGGETLFYDDDKEIIAAVKPLPGRFVLFDSKLLHSARPPQRHCPFYRYTIATKFRTDNLGI